MQLFKTISSWLSLSAVLLMLAFFLYACARVRLGMAQFWRERAGYWKERKNTERLKTNIVRTQDGETV